ncbi:MAG: 2-hydroxyacid dehydrogenase [Croceitalea sp.]|nr:2-hydroxyacid dehydrogenase [Croceitalea sp.]
MKLLVYSTKSFEIEPLKAANTGNHKITFVTESLDSTTAVLAAGYEAISIFSGDDASLVVLETLKDMGVRYITLRSAGYNNVSIKSALRLGLKVANAPDYSPHAIAEHAMGLILAWNRKLMQANKQVHQHNFLLDDLVGTNVHGKTIGVVGTGRIGSILIKIVHGFGCKLLATDIEQNHYLESEYDLKYVDLETLCKESDIVSINVPLNYETHHMFNKKVFSLMKKNALLVNTARGGVVKTVDLIAALVDGSIAGYATDVFENEKGIFFKDHNKKDINNEQLKALLAMPNVILTPHQAFVTKEAIKNIAETTLHNIDCWVEDRVNVNELGYYNVTSE